MIDAARRRQRRFGMLAVAAILLLANFNIVFLGQSLVATANYHPFDNRFTGMSPRDIGPAFVNWHDQGATWWQWEPAGQAFSRAFRRLHVPLWDPSIGAGVDAHTELTSGQYYPPYTLVLLAGNSALLRDAYYLAQLLFAGICALLLLLRHRFEMPAAVAFAACYVLGGAMTQNVNAILGQSQAVLPCLLLVTDWLIERPVARRIGLAALAYGNCVLASFLPIVISGFVLAALYVAVALFTRPHHRAVSAEGESAAPWTRRAIAIRSLAAVALGLGLTAFVLVPVEAISSSVEVFTRWYRDIGFIAYNLAQTITLVSPIVGFDAWQIPDRSLHLFPTDGAPMFYAGLLPILLACFARPGRLAGQRHLFVFFLVSAVLLAAKLLGLRPAQWLAYLPVLNTLHFAPYFGGALTLAIAGLAACGVQRLTMRRPTTVDVVCGPVLIAAAVWAALVFAATQPINAALPRRAFVHVAAGAAAEAARLLVVAIGFVGLVVLHRKRERPVLFGVGVVVLICAELLPLQARARFGRADVWRSPPQYVRLLQNDGSLFRIHSTHDLALTANVSQAFGISSIASRVPFNPDRYTELVRHYFETRPLPYPLPSALLPRSRVILDVLNVKYLIPVAPPDEEIARLDELGFEYRAKDGPFLLLVNRSVWPRAYVASRVTVAASPAAALEAVGNLQRGDVVLEESPRLVRAAAGVEARVSRIDYGDNRVRIDVTAAGPALVVLSDAWAPGWTAYVDGRPAPILRANYAFRAVEVPGTATVEFRYWPPGLTAGLIATATALLTVTALLLYGRTRPTRPVVPVVPAPKNG
ncbi:MAG: YfhO family protein [Acidobacteria bacterium]|nr:YfhO family protein [Acidobacteriota bacterium]